MLKSYQNQKNTIVMLIVKKQNLWKVIDQLQGKVNSQKFMVLKGQDQSYQDFFFVVYETNQIYDNMKYTVMHKKGRCFYTINALNELVKELNNGILNKEFIIDWKQYQNKILFIGREKELIKMNTSVYKIIKNRNIEV